MSEKTEVTVPGEAEEREGKYLIFSLAGEEYGIAIQKVKEIIGMMTITTLPQTPVFIKGVINLRGKVIPVVDLRLKFEMDGAQYTDRTCIIVVELNAGLDRVQVGIVVDTVSEVLNIRRTEIENAPDFVAGVHTDFILGMAKIGSGVKLLLDIDRIMNDQYFRDLPKAA